MSDETSVADGPAATGRRELNSAGAMGSEVG